MADGSVTLGTNLTATAFNSVVVGHYNALLPATTTTAWAATDPAFIVGIGQNTTAAANGLIVLNNGNTTITGNATLGSSSTTTVTIAGNVTINKPQGDIPMGVYDGN